MSRIGKLPIKVLDGVQIEIKGRNVKVTGPKGVLEREFSEKVNLNIEDGVLNVTVKNEADGAIHGTTRAILQNMVKGVKDGWQKKLELVGTGYRAEIKGTALSIAIGYSHPVVVEAPKGITFKVEKSDITVDGPDREVVGQVAATIRSSRPPEPYKGKGIRYKDEVVRRKAGKAAKAAGAA